MKRKANFADDIEPSSSSESSEDGIEQRIQSHRNRKFEPMDQSSEDDAEIAQGPEAMEQAYAEDTGYIEEPDFYGEPQDEDPGPTTPQRSDASFPPEWARPPVQRLERDECLVFQHVQTTQGRRGWGDDTRPIIRLWGVTKNENSVMVEIDDFYPYLWCKLPQQFETREIAQFVLNLNLAIHSKIFGQKKYLQRTDKRYFRSGFQAKKKDIYNYDPSAGHWFLKLTAELKDFIPIARKILTDGELTQYPYNFPCYEAKLDFALRFMVDTRLSGCQWIRLKKWRVRGQKESRTQIEVMCSVEDMYPIFITKPPNDDPIWDDMGRREQMESEQTIDDTAPVRILSFDIECKNRPGIFPEPEHDQVIQICCYMQVTGEDKPRFGAAFTLNKTLPHTVPGEKVWNFGDERRMLLAFREFCVHIDYDIDTGYNTDGFDWKYLMERAEHLGIGDVFSNMSRLLKRPCRIHKRRISSNAFGTNFFFELISEGRNSLDMMRFIKREYKLRTYSLNAVSEHFLGERKIDIHYSEISGLQNGTDADRSYLLKYCFKDALLPLRLWKDRMVGLKYIEMSRVTGIPIGTLLSRGVEIRIACLFTKMANMRGYLLPSFVRRTTGKYAGATVLEPSTGYYTDPVVTLDFSALYPSCIIEGNMCYSTYGKVSYFKKFLRPDQYIISKGDPTDAFVKKEVRESILSIVEETLLSQRRIAKGDMKAALKAGDMKRYKNFNARQLAIKLVANTGYGFLAGFIMPNVAIATAVTGRGRNMLEITRDKIHEHFTKENGYESDCKVIYGDTDSVFVLVPGVTKERACQIGDEASNICKKLFGYPHDLENEKTYCPLLLKKKKKYAGLMFEKPGAWYNLSFEQWKWEIVKNDPSKGITNGYSKIDAKGLENVRRDSALVVSKTIDQSIDYLLVKSDPESAIKNIHDLITRLRTNKVPIHDLIITKSISKTFEEYAKTGSKQEAVELAKRWMKRDAGSAPKVGDRVPYVIIDVEGTKDKKKRSRLAGTSVGARRNRNPIPKVEDVADKAEDPLYVIQNNLPINSDYYIWKQLMNPVLTLFGPVIAPDEDIELLIRGRPGDKEKGITSIPARPWTSKTFKALFGSSLSHMNKRIKTIPKTSPMFAFIKPRPKCFGCDSVINLKSGKNADGEPLCESCTNNRKDIVHRSQQDYKKACDVLQQKWKTCVDCLGDGSDIFRCSNKACENLYGREKAKMDMEDLGHRLSMLNHQDEFINHGKKICYDVLKNEN